EGLRGVDGFLPGSPVGARARHGEALGHLALAKAADDVECSLAALATLDHVVPLAALGGGEQLRIARHQLREKTKAIRVISHNQKVKRPGELDRLTARRGYLLAPCKPVGIPRCQPATERAGIHRERRVEV